MRQYIDKEEAQERLKALCEKFHLAYDEFSEDPNTMSYQLAHLFDGMEADTSLKMAEDLVEYMKSIYPSTESLRDNIYPMLYAKLEA